MNALATSNPLQGSHVRPNQALSVTESSRTLAEVQAALTIAAARPRDLLTVIDRIKTSCQRQRLAEGATYEFGRGGTKIGGASIRLLEAIAGVWGNIQFGFRELAQLRGESTVEAFAWDLETNTKRTVTFVVPHRMKAGQSIKELTDPRDIYEYVANQAQRRVRACLENVIPRDIVDEALDECQKTLRATVELTPEKIKKLVSTFKEDYGVAKEQIEKVIGRKLEAITPAQFINMQRIYVSLRDGMSEPDTWFKPLEAAAANSEGKSNANTIEKLKAAGSVTTASSLDSEPEPTSAFEHFTEKLNTSKIGVLASQRSSIQSATDLTEEQRSSLLELLNERISIIEQEAKE